MSKFIFIFLRIYTIADITLVFRWLYLLLIATELLLFLDNFKMLTLGNDFEKLTFGDNDAT